jgi:hypothetical protein
MKTCLLVLVLASSANAAITFSIDEETGLGVALGIDGGGSNFYDVHMMNISYNDMLEIPGVVFGREAEIAVGILTYELAASIPDETSLFSVIPGFDWPLFAVADPNSAGGDDFGTSWYQCYSTGDPPVGQRVCGFYDTQIFTGFDIPFRLPVVTHANWPQTGLGLNLLENRSFESPEDTVGLPTTLATGAGT